VLATLFGGDGYRSGGGECEKSYSGPSSDCKSLVEFAWTFHRQVLACYLQNWSTIACYYLGLAADLGVHLSHLLTPLLMSLYYPCSYPTPQCTGQKLLELLQLYCNARQTTNNVTNWNISSPGHPSITIDNKKRSCNVLV
jgi:hypothetical protein